MQGTNCPAVSKNLSVYVRIRPATKNDAAGDISDVQFGVSEGKSGGNKAPNHSAGSAAVVVGGPEAKCSGKGFDVVFDGTAKNKDVFEATLAPHMAKVLNGETVGCFCYGHTGSGKTHTAIGYGEERGLLGEALGVVTALHKQRQEQVEQNEGTTSSASLLKDIFFVVRFVEIYNDKGFDLLSEPARAPMILREDENGNVQYRGETHKDNATWEVETGELTEVVVRDESDVNDVVRRGMKNRSVGNSNLHSQSSRSHALVQVEVVSKELLQARHATKKAHSDKQQYGSRRDTAKIALDAAMYRRDPATGSWIVSEAPPELQQAFDDAEAAFQPYEQRYVECRAAEQQVMKKSPFALGGNFVLVDLAGSESSALSSAAGNTEKTGGAAARGQPVKQDVKAKKEAAQINTSLLALKECIRGLTTAQGTAAGSKAATGGTAAAASSSSSSRIPFRNSKLTMALREFLLCDKGCTTIMIANCCAVTSQLPLTKSTLQYAQLLTSAVAK